MSEEQTIYINPEDDLTTVRERLEQIPSQRIALVIPRQTQLRSHVAWNNLYRRAHELDKDVLIISSDAQIRSVAQAAQFRVAHSQEATSTMGRARAASYTGRRSAMKNRREVTQSPPTRNAPNGQGARSVQKPRGTGNVYQENSVADRSIVEPISDSRPPHEDDVPLSGSMSQPASSTFDDQHYSHSYNFRNTTPPIVPLSSEQMLEEPDSLSEDFNQALDIRRAAMEGHEESKAQVVQEPLQTHSITPLPNESQDPFINMEDSLTSPIPEQRGSASVDEYAIHGRSESPIDIVDGEIEYQGDQGDFVIHFDTPETPPHAVSDPIPEDTQDTAGPAPTFSARRSRIRRSTQLSPQPDLESHDALPPIEDRPIQASPPPSTSSPSRQLASASNSEQVSQQALPNKRTRASLSGSVPRQAGQQGATRTGRVAGTPARPIAPRRPTAQRRSVGANSLLIALVILLVLLLGGLVYFGPAATVTLTLFSQNFTAPVKLVASPSPARGTVLGYLHTTSFKQSGTGKATGTKKVGTAQATGTVTFTNNGTDPVEIPTGTVVNTSTGVQFMTTTDVVVHEKNSSLGNTTIPIPIQALKSGGSGNVSSGSITIIPDDSLSAIATYDKLSTSSLHLLVTNDAATSGGGVGTTSTVTAADLKTAQAALHTQLATQVADWVKSQLAPDDIASNPTTIETVTSAPLVGQIADTGTFPMTLSINVKVLVVRSSTIQQASIAQLDNALQKKQGGYMIAPNTTVGVTQLKTTGDSNTLTLDFTATGKAVPIIDKQKVQSLIAGKSLTEAQSLLKTANVEHVAIQVSPSFITFVPWWTGHINVKIVPGTTQLPK